MAKIVPHFAVKIITCARNQSLLRLINNLAKQEASLHSMNPFTYAVEVIDNSKAHPLSAEEIQLIRKYGAAYSFLGAENIAIARNFALNQCSADFLAFIDDDELASLDWLSQLWRAFYDHGADVVFGPNIPWFPEGAPRWLIDSDIFNPSYPISGEEEGFTWSTANCGIRMASLRSTGTKRIRFNEKLGECGGSDTDFFQQLLSLGFRFYWTRRAITYEAYEKSRAQLGWVIKRAYRCGGVSTAICEKWNIDRYAGRLLEVALIPFRMFSVVATLRFGTKFVRHALPEVRRLCFALGILTYVLTGRVWCEYQRKGLVKLNLGGSRPSLRGMLAQVFHLYLGERQTA